MSTCNRFQRIGNSFVVAIGVMLAAVGARAATDPTTIDRTGDNANAASWPTWSSINCLLQNESGRPLGTARIEVQNIQLNKDRLGGSTFMATADFVVHKSPENDRHIGIQIKGGDLWKNSYVSGVTGASIGVISPGIGVAHLTGEFTGTWGFLYGLEQAGETVIVTCPRDRVEE